MLAVVIVGVCTLCSLEVERHKSTKKMSRKKTQITVPAPDIHKQTQPSPKMRQFQINILHQKYNNFKIISQIHKNNSNKNVLPVNHSYSNKYKTEKKQENTEYVCMTLADQSIC